MDFRQFFTVSNSMKTYVLLYIYIDLINDGKQNCLYRKHLSAKLYAYIHVQVYNQNYNHKSNSMIPS